MSVHEATEMLLCAQANLENLAKMCPGVREHPFYEITKMQLDSAVEMLELATEADT